MAGVEDLMPYAAPERQPTQNNQGVVNEWSTALQDNGFRSALINFGLNLMQPPGAGQTPMGHLGRAIGAAGEGYGRIEEADLKERKLEGDLDVKDRTLDFTRRRTEASEKNAETRRMNAQRTAQGGGLSAKDIVRYQIQSKRDLEAKAKWEAKAIREQIDNALDPRDLPPTVAKYKDMTAGDIARGLLADPEFIKKSQLSRDSILQSTIPQPNERVVGRVYQTPKGPMVWQGSGRWTPAQAAAPSTGGADIEDEDDE